MIFTEIVDLVLLAVNGGEFTSEAAVQRPDAEAYVPQACHTVIRNAVFGLKADARAERAQTGIAAGTIDPGFFVVYDLDLTLDDEREMRYADLPGVIQSWPGDAGLDVVYTKGPPTRTYTKIHGPFEYDGLGDLADNLDLYWHERYGSDTTVSRIWVPGKGDGACSILVRAAVEISSALGDTTLPLPVGLESLVIQMAVEHFRGQRSMPADATVNNQDVNAQMDQKSPQASA